MNRERDSAESLGEALELLSRRDVDGVRQHLRENQSFTLVEPEERRYTTDEQLRVFLRDGFVDRYTGRKLVNPGVLRLLSVVAPAEFPFHPNWKMSACHPAYWQLFPTVDHLVPIARGGKDVFENWVTTSMLANSAKSNWTLAELGWTLRPTGSFSAWDGLSQSFLDAIAANPSVLPESRYVSRWWRATKKALASLAR